MTRGDVVSIKMLDGSEIIGRVEKDDAEYLELKMPMIFMVHQMPDGRPSAQMAPIMFSTTKDVIPIRKSLIAFGPVETAENIKKGYMKETSPIVLPN